MTLTSSTTFTLPIGVFCSLQSTSFLHYCLKKECGPSSANFFLIIWAFNWSITLAYCGYLFPISGSKTIIRSSIIHSVPLILTLIEFSVYNIKVKRIDFIYPMSCLLFYQLCLLMPFTLLVRPLYSEITFNSILSFGICIGLLLVAYIMLEVLKLLKDHMLKSKNKQLIRSWIRVGVGDLNV